MLTLRIMVQDFLRIERSFLNLTLLTNLMVLDWGLAICKKIIEDHNGEIELHDGPLLGGALVRIKF